jgi:type II secretory pathway component GspD/PulD (secretin)
MVARAKAGTWGNLVIALLAGTAVAGPTRVQAFPEGVPNAPAWADNNGRAGTPYARAASPAQPAPADARPVVRDLLARARAQLAQGNFEAAEGLAREAEKYRVAYGKSDDNPRRVLDDLARAKMNPKALLLASRCALKRNQLDLAERYARSADKLSSFWTFPVWGDTPSKALRDVQTAKARSPGARPAPVAKAPAPATKPVASDGGARPQAATPVARGPVAPAGRAPASKPAPPAKTTGQQARELLALGRTQLSQNKLEDAQKTVQRIKALPGVSWGLFEDTPDSLLRDVEKARGQRDRAESAKLLTEGRKLLARGDLDGAARAASRAEKLHGPYGIFDLGDRPSKLLSDVQAARARAQKSSGTTAVAQGPKGPGKPPTPGAPNTTPPAGAWRVGAPGSATQPGAKAVAANPPARPGQDPALKRRARELVAEAQRCQKEGNLLLARQKAVEAQRLGAAFGPGEVSPEMVYQEVAASVRRRVDSLVRQADETAAYGTGDPQVRYQQAEARLVEARQLAANFGQDLQPVDQRLAQMRRMRAAKGPEMAREGKPAVASPAVATRPANPPVTPAGGAPAGVAGGTPGAVVLTGGSVSPPAPPPAQDLLAKGQEKLAQARLELRKGETNLARRFAEEAIKGGYGVNDEAVALLRTIDTEEFNQKRKAANRTFDAALSAYNRKEYAHAGTMMAAIDTRLLDEPRKARLREVMMTPEMKSAPGAPEPTGVARASDRAAEGGAVIPAKGPGKPPEAEPEEGHARATDKPEDELLDKVKAERKILLDKMRTESLEVQRQANEKFRTGQMDVAIEMLRDHLARLGQADLEREDLARLKRPVESRLSSYNLIKAQRELAEGPNKRAQAARERIQAKVDAEQVKNQNVNQLMKQFYELYKTGKYEEAQGVAMRAHELDPDNGVIATAIHMARRQMAVKDAKGLKERKEDTFLTAANYNDDPGDTAATIKGGGIHVDRETMERTRKRPKLGPFTINPLGEKEQEIERKLSTPVNLNFKDAPLQQVVNDLRDYNAINIVIDEPALREDGISLDSPLSIQLNQVSLKSALNLLLHQVRLTYVIRDEALQITTEAHAKGRIQTKTYAVADLVIPIHDFGDIRDPKPFIPLGTPLNQRSPGAPTPVPGPMSLPPGTPTGTPAGATSSQGGAPGAGPFGPAADVSSGTWTKSGSGKTMEDMLIKLITNTIAPRSWTEMGGAGTIDYHPLTMALVVSQTPDIQEQVADLLAALRRLQDQEVSVEVRFITVAEDFFERIGVNFNLNILTDKRNFKFEPSLVTGNFAVDPTRFINAFDPKHFIAGLTPAGTLTSTLDIPITVQTFQQAVPPFGGYQGTPGFGGITMGLAFLSDIQVFLFLEAVQGDVRTNVMQAPKLTLFNGQTASITISDTQFFVTGVTIDVMQGQFLYSPQVMPFNNMVMLFVNAVITADRRFVRLSVTPTIQNLATPQVNLFPVVTPIFPLFDGTATGQPIVFTQFIQQPVLSSITVLSTVMVPDGGTVLLGGLKRLSEGRNEFGPPILSKIPYLNRLFKNVGYGRETHSLLMMVTPRIIIQEEEEERATGFRATPEAGGVP